MVARETFSVRNINRRRDVCYNDKRTDSISWIMYTKTDSRRDVEAIMNAGREGKGSAKITCVRRSERNEEGIRIVLQVADEVRGVSALDRWNRSMFLSDFLAMRLRDEVSEGGISSCGTSWTSRKSKVVRVRERDDGTKSDRCLFGLAGLRPVLRVVDEGDTSRKSGGRTATPSVEFRVGKGRRRSDDCSSMLALEEEGNDAEVLRRKDVRRSHWTMPLE